MNRTASSTLMTEGSIWKKIVTFAFPLFLGNLFQQLYNTADSLIVGNFLGSDALAAVSSSGSLIFLMVGFFNGIAMGAGALHTLVRSLFAVSKSIAAKLSIDSFSDFSPCIGIEQTTVAHGVVHHFKAGHRDGRMRKFSLFAKSLSITSYNFINIHRILLFLSVITNV